MDSEQRATTSDWVSPRVIHLLGGLRAAHGKDAQVRLHPGLTSGFLLQGQSYGGLYLQLAQLGLPLVGTDFFAHQIEREGLSPPDWRVFSIGCGDVWIGQSAADTWALIRRPGKAAGHEKALRLAGHISHHLRACAWRLRQVSHAYHEQLIAWIRHGKFKHGQRSMDGFTWAIFLTIESYLIEACRLRDRLTRFFVTLVLGHGEASLKEKALQRLLKDAGDKGDELARALLQARLPGGWLKQLGSYRDMVIHATPLQQAGAQLAAVMHLQECSVAGLSLPTVFCPIPCDPDSVQAWMNGAPAPAEFQCEDALLYLRDTYAKLAVMAREIALRSPIVPQEPPRFTGPATRNLDGTVSFTVTADELELMFGGGGAATKSAGSTQSK